jgi:hypothetical protein
MRTFESQRMAAATLSFLVGLKEFGALRSLFNSILASSSKTQLHHLPLRYISAETNAAGYYWGKSGGVLLGIFRLVGGSMKFLHRQIPALPDRR